MSEPLNNLGSKVNKKYNSFDVNQTIQNHDNDISGEEGFRQHNSSDSFIVNMDNKSSKRTWMKVIGSVSIGAIVLLTLSISFPQNDMYAIRSMSTSSNQFETSIQENIESDAYRYQVNVLNALKSMLGGWASGGNKKAQPAQTSSHRRPILEKTIKDFSFGANVQLRQPFSTVSPYEATAGEKAMIPPLDRPKISRPGPVFGPKLSHGALKSGTALPTNAWYQNLLIGEGLEVKPNDAQRVYTVPYVNDFIGPIPGIRTNYPFATGGDTVVQMTFNPDHGLTLGTKYGKPGDDDFGYTIVDVEDDKKIFGFQDSRESFSPLSVHLKWERDQKEGLMTAPIVRGMPYNTMIYLGDVKPVIASQIPISKPPIIDGNIHLQCDNGTAVVKDDVELYFRGSDYTWLVFYSRPVTVSCTTKTNGTAEFELLVSEDDLNEEEPMVVRTALQNNCTTGANPSYCHWGRPSNNTQYGEILRKHAGTYPYHSKMEYTIDKKDDIHDEPENVNVLFDWNVRTMSEKNKHEEAVMFALPHHMEFLQDYETYEICTPTFHGQTCIVIGNIWTMEEKLPSLKYTAPRPPKAEFVSPLAESLVHDLNFSLPDYFERGGGDTYFSGKMLAKLGRVLIIADELKGLQDAENIDDLHYPYSDLDITELKDTMSACQEVTLPSEETFADTLARLRSSVEIWINGTAETPFIYDTSWGGVISCGCLFDEKIMACGNRFPDCPSYGMSGLNFGNGYYNDHHYHYGYHIYAASIVAHFDPQWGRDHFEQVNLLVRDIANPSTEDNYFPVFRHKDWYVGNSWANGIPLIGGQPYVNGRNQESSSEAISAYEGVSLWGASMVAAWLDDGNNEKAHVAAHIRDVGRLLTSSELRAASTYYHIRHFGNQPRIYPLSYTRNVVGMMWSMMIQFQTWFGNAPFLAVGIQLLPITPVSEQRDDIDWVKELYSDYANSCDVDPICMQEGWAILQFALLAEVGYPDLARDRALNMSTAVFDTAGGNGHSLSNTLWYLSSRPKTRPLPLTTKDIFNCGCPDSCTSWAQNKDANGATCKARIEWLVNVRGVSDLEACRAIGAREYPEYCSACDPDTCAMSPEEPSAVRPAAAAAPPPPPPDLTCSCPKTCTKEVLSSIAEGANCGNRIEWLINNVGLGEDEACNQVGGVDYPHICGDCDPVGCGVNITHHKKPEEISVNETITGNATTGCGLCSQEVCQSSLNRCPLPGAPYLCVKGQNRGGCSQTPWIGKNDFAPLCHACCLLTDHCAQGLLK